MLLLLGKRLSNPLNSVSVGPNYGQNGKEKLSENGGAVIFIFSKYGNGELFVLIIIVCNVNAIAGIYQVYTILSLYKRKIRISFSYVVLA